MGGLALIALFGAGCGGGGGNAVAPVPPPPPGFTLSLNPAQVTLSAGGAAQTITATVTAQGGFSQTVSLTLGAPPAGITVSPASLSVAPGGAGSFQISAVANAVIGAQQLAVNASGGGITASASLQISIPGSPVPDPFYATGGALAHAFYDPVRQLLFATNPGLNELDIFSGQNLSLVRRVPLPQPWGIDQMADGHTLVIGTDAQEILTVDEDTLAVTAHPYSAAATGDLSLFFPNVVALANGKVLIIGQEQGIESGNILEGGQFLFSWDSATGTFTQLEPTAQNAENWETDSLARSANHEWAVLSADQFYLYSSATDSLTAVPLSTVNPPSDEYGVRGYAVNADGSEIAVASANEVVFFNGSFQPLGTAALPAALQNGSPLQFSADGKTLYLGNGSAVAPALEAVNAVTFTPLGFRSAYVAGGDNLTRFLTTDTQQRAYFAIAGGLRVVNLTQTPLTRTVNILSGPECPLLNFILPLGGPRQEPFNYVGDLGGPLRGVSLYLGGQPAPAEAGGTAVETPGSAVAGPVDLECIDTSGNTSVVPAAVSYGTQVAGLSASLLPPGAPAPAYLYGYGFASANGDAPQVEIGGQTASGVSLLAPDFIGTLQGLSLQAPGGSPLDSAGATVLSSLGQGGLPSAASDIAAASLIPASGVLELLFDPHRNLLYALKATEVDVLDPATGQWQTPIALPQPSPPVAYDALALSPDGAWLAAASADGHIAVVNLAQPGSGTVVTTNAYLYNQSGSLSFTSFDQIIFSGYPTIIVSLPGLSVTRLTNSYGQDLSAGNLIRASADGTHIYGADLNSNNGEVYSFDPATLTVKTEGFGLLSWTDLAVNADGSEFAAVDAPPFAAGDIIGFFDPALQYLNANVYPEFSQPTGNGVLGAAFSPGGKVLVIALGDSIEFWSVSTGQLMARLASPEPLDTITYPEGPAAPRLAIDPAGQTIYVVAASGGIAALKLAEPMDQLTPAQWREGAARRRRPIGVTARMRAQRPPPRRKESQPKTSASPAVAAPAGA